MYLDPTASHLIICTSLGDNYYLHSQSRTPRPLGKLRGVSIESIAWSPLLPTASTGEILIGAADGNIYETYIETSHDFYKRELKHLKVLHKLPDGPITGLWADNLRGKSDMRRVVISTPVRLFHLVGKLGNSQESNGSIYTKMFGSEQPVVHEISRTTSGGHSSLAVSPDPSQNASHDHGASHRAYAWLSPQGVFQGSLLDSPADGKLGNIVFSESKMLPRSSIVTTEVQGRRKATAEAIDAIALTQWHIINLVGSRVIIINRLTGEMVSEHDVLDKNQHPIGFSVDLQMKTFWLFTSQEVFEIVVHDEDRDIWSIMMKTQQYEAALRHTHTPTQRETVAAAFGDHLASKGHWAQAATVYGRSNKPFEDIALSIIDNNQPDALRQFLVTRLSATKRSATMQRMMIATWLVEIFTAKLNTLDDAIITRAELEETLSQTESQKVLDSVRKEYQNFVLTYKQDLDRKTVYDIISSHGREQELLFFANTINDYNYVLSYWVQRERWNEALDVLRKQTDPEVFYRYSSVLMAHVPTETVDIMMRHSSLKARSIVPALLEYNRTFSGPTSQNQAVRYLNYHVYQLNSKDVAVHNTLVTIYALHPSKDESGLLSYLQAQGDEPRYDPDFALRLCIQHHRTLSCVHIYTSMEQYLQAVDLALSHNEVELAAVIADRPISNPTLRKRLWLAVARKVISQSNGIQKAIEFLKRCELLKIEDLIPFFPDFVVIDDFKEEICGALEDYSRSIDALKQQMDESSLTATNIKVDIAALDHRYAIVEPGEKCYVCGLPLLSRQFFIFPCQHSFHSDCLGRKVMEQAGVGKSSRIKDLQVQIHKGLVGGARRDAVVAELDSLVAAAW